MRNYWLLITLLCCSTVIAQADVQLHDVSGQTPQLSLLDKQYIVDRLSRLDLELCRTRLLREQPRLIYRRLILPHGGNILTIDAADDVMRTGNMVIYQESGSEWREYYDCPNDVLLPALAIIATAKVEGQEIGSNRIRQEVLARHTQLSSHEASKLMLRTDSGNESHPYMDFTLSLKHPLLSDLAPLKQLQGHAADLLEDLIPGDDEYLLQLYLAFTGRFSQYIGSRDSSPVIARRFNPSVFYRVWNSDSAWFDIGFGHESNGQRINTQDGYQRERADFTTRGENPDFARDALSRGWDYTFFEWQHGWSEHLNTQLKLRHYLTTGPLQGKSEEYNVWEDGGTLLRPRNQYDGVSLTLQYQFNRSRCFLGSSFICLKDLELTQETGYSHMFEHNTTTVEFTSDFFGLPIQLWSRTGYVNDMIDYYRYTKSWGLGIELKTP